MTRAYSDRREAGLALADVISLRNYDNPLVLALPRGGVPVAAEVAKALRAPMDLVLVRKIGTPGQPELALGAIVNGQSPQIVINEDIRIQADITDQEIERATQQQLAEIERRRVLYLRDRKRFPVKNKTAIVVDDGIATGATVRAALRALRMADPGRLVLAVPVAPADTIRMLEREVDECICLAMPEPFYSVGLHYGNFDPVPDEEVAPLMAQAVDWN